jgi:hypothetical protein
MGKTVSRAPPPLVRWTGRAATPALAIPCPTCDAPIERQCDGAVFPLPHPERDLRAKVFGFVQVRDPGPLFGEVA